jgi:hypothetical protein
VGTRVLPGRGIANLLIVFGIGEAFLRDFPVSGFSDVTDRENGRAKTITRFLERLLPA